jgi:dihydroorotase
MDAFTLFLKNCTVVNANGRFQADIGVRGGKIVYMGAPGALGACQAEKEVDAAGLYVLPGLIDAHVHLRDPGLLYKEDLPHGTAAAACGGITMVCDMPNTKPNVAEKQVLLDKIANAEGRAYVDYAFYAMVSDGNLDNVDGLAEAEPCAFKCYMALTSMKNPQISDAGMRSALRRIAPHGYALHIHAENTNIINAAKEELIASGRTDWQAYLEGRPDISEYEPIQRAITLAEELGGRIHICHITTKEAVRLIRDAKRRGVHVTCETGPQCLLFSEEDYNRIGPPLFVNPPVRYKADREELWAGIADGTIDFIATDHAPHTREEKYRGAWHECQPGSAGVEQNIPVMLTLVNAGKLSLERVAALCAENPARHLGVYPRKGIVQIGAEGTFTIVDMNCKKTLRDAEAHSVNCVTPYDGFEATAMPVYTIVRGEIVMDHGEITAPLTTGQYIKRG